MNNNPTPYVSIILLLLLASAFAFVGREFWNNSGAPGSTATSTDPYTITAADNGNTFSYPLTSRFTVILDSTRYPKSELTCAPAGILGSISNIPPVSPPLYAARFETVAQGSCTLSDRDFSVRIVVPAPVSTASSGGGSGILPFHSGAEGVVLVGPTCPVESSPPDPQCAPKPYAGKIVVYPAGRSEIFSIASSDASGAFKISLPPGSYVLSVESASPFPRCARVPVTISPDIYTTANILCDSGIR